MPPEGLRQRTYLVEQYRPGNDAEALARYAKRVSAAASQLKNEGLSVRHVRSTIVPGEESLLCLIEAESEGLVRAVYSRAGVTFDRISEAVALDHRGATSAGRTPSTRRRDGSPHPG